MHSTQNILLLLRKDTDSLQGTWKLIQKFTILGHFLKKIKIKQFKIYIYIFILILKIN